VILVSHYNASLVMWRAQCFIVVVTIPARDLERVLLATDSAYTFYKHLTTALYHWRSSAESASE